MISISCLDPETKKACKIHCKSYDQIVLKLERGEGKKKDKYWVLLVQEGKWYAIPFEEYNTHLEEAEIEDGACDMDIELEETSGSEEKPACSLIPKWMTISDWQGTKYPNLSPKEWAIALSAWNSAREFEEFEESGENNGD